MVDEERLRKWDRLNDSSHTSTTSLEQLYKEKIKIIETEGKERILRQQLWRTPLNVIERWRGVLIYSQNPVQINTSFSDTKDKLLVLLNKRKGLMEKMKGQLTTFVHFLERVQKIADQTILVRDWQFTPTERDEKNRWRREFKENTELITAIRSSIKGANDMLTGELASSIALLTDYITIKIEKELQVESLSFPSPPSAEVLGGLVKVFNQSLLPPLLSPSNKLAITRVSTSTEMAAEETRTFFYSLHDGAGVEAGEIEDNRAEILKLMEDYKNYVINQEFKKRANDALTDVVLLCDQIYYNSL